MICLPTQNSGSYILSRFNLFYLQALLGRKAIFIRQLVMNIKMIFLLILLSSHEHSQQRSLKTFNLSIIIFWRVINGIQQFILANVVPSVRQVIPNVQLLDSKWIYSNCLIFFVT
ncbi:unnamed protein product [Paramecium primaurelia]|uniref:Uncharacterized protein n=1 Tax=Paramecium primaurelia TaxID=5886 RepID=A0A8S1NKW6_PARPR|nr:unnamed protein product [Paramecium primaurelia]